MRHSSLTDRSCCCRESETATLSPSRTWTKSAPAWKNACRAPPFRAPHAPALSSLQMMRHHIYHRDITTDRGTVSKFTISHTSWRRTTKLRVRRYAAWVRVASRGVDKPDTDIDSNLNIRFTSQKSKTVEPRWSPSCVLHGQSHQLHANDSNLTLRLASLSRRICSCRAAFLAIFSFSIDMCSSNMRLL